MVFILFLYLYIHLYFLLFVFASNICISCHIEQFCVDLRCSGCTEPSFCTGPSNKQSIFVVVVVVAPSLHSAPTTKQSIFSLFKVSCHSVTESKMESRLVVHVKMGCSSGYMCLTLTR